MDARGALARTPGGARGAVTSTVASIAGLRTLVVSGSDAPRLVVVVLHGYAMRPEDLAPFAASIGVPASFYLPEAPLEAEPSGRAWWPIDQERRSRAMAHGSRDLHGEHPSGAGAARALVMRVLAEVGHRHAGLPLVLVGFSQGGMLACDMLVRDGPVVAGLALLSASRISADEWIPLASRFAGLPILVSHGTDDPDLAFGAGEALRDLCISGGGEVVWVPFQGGHEIPMVAWRAIRKFLGRLVGGAG